MSLVARMIALQPRPTPETLPVPGSTRRWQPLLSPSLWAIGELLGENVALKSQRGLLGVVRSSLW